MQKGLESLAFIFALPHGDPFVGGIQKSIPPPLICPKSPQIEAIQTSLFVDVPDVLVTVFIRNVSTSKSKSTSTFLRYPAIPFVPMSHSTFNLSPIIVLK